MRLDNRIKVETCCPCCDFMSGMSHCDLNSSSMYSQRSKGQAPAVLGGLHYAQNIQSHLKTIRLNHLHERAERGADF